MREIAYRTCVHHSNALQNEARVLEECRTYDRRLRSLEDAELTASGADDSWTNESDD